jgi:WD40-like Beta Propeller Repeat
MPDPLAPLLVRFDVFELEDRVIDFSPSWSPDGLLIAFLRVLPAAASSLDGRVQGEASPWLTEPFG